MEPIISVEHVSKSYGDIPVLSDICIEVEKGDICGILGLSGAGKSTLVRCINGLETIDSGDIKFKGRSIYSNGKVVPFITSSISMIFQQFNLFEQMSVLHNVMFPLQIRHYKRNYCMDKAMRLLERVGLADKYKMFPSQLSGGQKQRVAIARALMTDPEVLLCDEATSALDAETTDSILKLLKELNSELNVTILIIAHQMSVIEAICNNVAIIDKSRIVEVGSLWDVFLAPKTDIAKRLVYAGNAATKLSERVIRLVFDGDPDMPVVTSIVQECNILVSIVYAQTKIMAGNMYGQMLIRLPYYDEDIKKLETFLRLRGIKYEEVDMEGNYDGK